MDPTKGGFTSIHVQMYRIELFFTGLEGRFTCDGKYGSEMSAIGDEFILQKKGSQTLRGSCLARCLVP